MQVFGTDRGAEWDTLWRSAVAVVAGGMDVRAELTLNWAPTSDEKDIQDWMIQGEKIVSLSCREVLTSLLT